MAAQTAKQKANEVKFRAAIAYHKKNPNLTKKQAFAHVYGKRVLNGTTKKKVVKKAPSSPLKRQGVKAKAAPVKITKKVVTRKVSIGKVKVPSVPHGTSKNVTPSQIALRELNRELGYKTSLEKDLISYKAKLKMAAPSERSGINQNIRTTENMLSYTKSNISNLKRAIK